MLRYVPDERVKTSFIRCHAIWERGRKRCDRHRVSIWTWWSSTQSLFPADSLSHGEQRDKERFQAAVGWACRTAACTSCWCTDATAVDNYPVRIWQCRKLFIKEGLKEFLRLLLSQTGTKFFWESQKWAQFKPVLQSWHLHSVREHHGGQFELFLQWLTMAAIILNVSFINLLSISETPLKNLLNFSLCPPKYLTLVTPTCLCAKFFIAEVFHIPLLKRAMSIHITKIWDLTLICMLDLVCHKFLKLTAYRETWQLPVQSQLCITAMSATVCYRLTS